MALIVLDKSWLISKSTKEIIEIAKENQFLIIAALFYEILTASDPLQRDGCFHKLKNIEDSCFLIEHVGHLLNYEFTNKRQCTPIERLVIDEDFYFNDDFANRGFPFTEEQQESLKYFKNTWEIEGVVHYVEMGESVMSFVPQLANMEKTNDKSKFDELKKTVANDNELVHSIFSQFNRKDLPNPAQLTENWAIFRWIQMRIIDGIEYYRKYGKQRSIITLPKLANARLDLEYEITGLLTQNLGTKDQTIIENCRIASETIYIF